MSAIAVAIFSIFCLALGYALYSRILAGKVFMLDDSHPTPSHTRQDGVDYVPTKPTILFGHHFATIAGLAPMLGPALAVIWGWVPAVLWVLLGSIFLGAVHDFGALVLSIRHEGTSIGDLAERLVGPRARVLFLLVSFFLLSLAMGVFAYVVGGLFSGPHPEAVVPVFALMPIAIGVGLLVYRVNMKVWMATVIGLSLMMLMIWVGVHHPVKDIARPWLSVLGYDVAAYSAAEIQAASRDLWVVILLAYAAVASMLPVWLLLQPRDYLNSYKLYLGMAAMYMGLLIARPQITAPAVNTADTGAPSLFPFLFITIACGAISGFHNLVASGTTSKQLDRESHARPIGFGGMLAEGALAMVAILACTAGIGDRAAWLSHYASWKSAGSLTYKLDAFVRGAGEFISHLGVNAEYARAFVAVVVVAFAMTTLDSGTRLLRYNITELARWRDKRPMLSRYLPSIAAVVAIGFFALLKVHGKPAGIALWQLFGSTNQLLAALGLLAASVYLFRLGRRTLYTLLPMIFMLAVTLTALVMKGMQFYHGRSWALLVVGAAIFVMAVWLAIEAAAACARFKRAGGTMR